MKTKMYYFSLIVIFVSVLINGCKKEEKAPVVSKEPIKITAEEFALLSAITVDKQGLQENFSRFIIKSGYQITDVEADGAKVINFPSIFQYDKLKPILKEFPLSIQLICSAGSRIKIENYEDFVNNYGPEDGLFSVDPKPKYIVYVGDKIFLVGYKLKLWKTHKQVSAGKTIK
jgi:hypothetical protein